MWSRDRKGAESSRCGCAPAGFLLQMHRLRERAVTGGIPNGEADPLLAGRVERNAELVIAERRHFRHADHFAIHLLAVAPYQFGEFRWEGPLHVRVVESPGAGALDARTAQQDLAAADEIIAGAQYVEHGS